MGDLGCHVIHLSTTWALKLRVAQLSQQLRALMMITLQNFFHFPEILVIDLA